MRVPEQEIDDLSIQLDFLLGLVSRGERMVGVGGRCQHDERPAKAISSDLRCLHVCLHYFFFKVLYTASMNMMSSTARVATVEAVVLAASVSPPSLVAGSFLFLRDPRCDLS